MPRREEFTDESGEIINCQVMGTLYIDDTRYARPIDRFSLLSSADYFVANENHYRVQSQDEVYGLREIFESAIERSLNL